MKWLAMAMGLAALSSAALPPAPAAGASVDGPKVLLIGPNPNAGSVRASGYAALGFGGVPVVDVHALSTELKIRDVAVLPGAPGAATFSFLLDYTAAAPNTLQVEITVSGGSGNTKDGVEKFLVTVKRL